MIPYARNASFYWPIDELRNVDQSIQLLRHFDNRRFTHCQLDAKSIRALRFSKPAQLFWNIGVLRLDEPLSPAHCVPLKSQNWARNVVYRSSTLHLFQMQNVGLGSTGVFRKENFDILGQKVVAFLPFAFPPPLIFLYSLSVFSVLGIY